MMVQISASTALVCVVLAMCTVGASSQMNVVTSSDGSYRVIVQGQTWLHSGPTFFYNNGHKLSTEDDTLKMLYLPDISAGMDSLGEWNMVNFTYATGSPNGEDKVNVYIRSYKDLPVVLFSQLFRNGVKMSSTGDKNKVISGFPSFYIDDHPGLGFLDYGGLFVGWSSMVSGKWSPGMAHITDGMDGGPLALFDTKGNALVISPFNQFMAASSSHNTNASTMSWGIMGNVDSVPDGFLVEFILHYSSEGINQAMAGWGDCLRKWYRKSPYYRDEDPSVKYVGYYTDNGAYYYHATEPGLNYEDTMLGVYNYAKQNNITYRYLQYDDWWYPITGKGYGATVTWDALPSVFPHGLRYLYNITKLPVVAHNRYWSSKTTYAKQNGGPYEFIMDKDMSLPVDQKFWDDLFATAIQWGLIVYEQDWLNKQTDEIDQLSSNLTLGREWLMQMGEAASRYGLRLQYCMALPRNILQSLEIQAVTQARASTDYPITDNQWRVGISSMFAHAVGLAPFKDNFWTTTTQPGNRYNRTEPHPEFEAIVSVLTSGPVGPSDRIGYSNGSIIRKCHAADGLLLKPSKPAMAIDEQIIQMAFNPKDQPLGPVGEVWSTYSDISGFRFGIIFSGDLAGQYEIGPTKAGFRNQFQRSVAYWHGFQWMEDKVEPFSDEAPLQLKACNKGDMCLYYTSPVFNWRDMTIIFLGELDKYIPISPQRVTSISIGDSDLQMTLQGSPGEVVNFYIAIAVSQPGVSFPIECRISDLGSAILSIADRSCH